MIKQIISVFFAKSSVAIINLFILIIGSKQLGSDVWGQISLFVLNLSIIHTFSEMFTGTALVYFITKIPLRKLYTSGLLWSLVCAALISITFYYIQNLSYKLTLNTFFVSLLLSLNGFHQVILLAKEKVKAYNYLLVLQPMLLLISLVISIKVFNNHSNSSYLIALYFSFAVSLFVSTFFIVKLPSIKTTNHQTLKLSDAFKNGFINQLGNLAHTLSNRFNFYLLGSTVLVGVYASATSLIESLWIIGGSISPIVLTRVANHPIHPNNARTTLALSKLSFIISAVCVLLLYLIPTQVFEFVLGKDFSQTKNIMLLLSPGVLCISFSTILSHYFSALGKQSILLLANSCGFITTLLTAWYFINRFGIYGACYAASFSYFVQALVLLSTFKAKNTFSFSEFLSLKTDIAFLRNDKNS